MSGELRNAAARLVVARALNIDRVTAEMVTAFRAAGVPSIVLKGPTLATWLYEDGVPRGYVDSDLLVRSADMETAEGVLQQRGFEEVAIESPHATTWARRGSGEQVDLHFTLPGLSLAPADAWREIAARTETISIGGAEVEGPGVVLRTLLVALHAAHHGREVEQPMRDLRRALDKVPDDIWREAAALAQRLGATAPFATALRLLPEGEALAERIRLPSAELIASATAVDSRAPIVLGLERLADARGAREKLPLLARELVPTREFMRWWSPLARRGPLGLGVAYPLRVIWLLRHARGSIRAWRRGRRLA